MESALGLSDDLQTELSLLLLHALKPRQSQLYSTDPIFLTKSEHTCCTISTVICFIFVHLNFVLYIFS